MNVGQACSAVISLAGGGDRDCGMGVVGLSASAGFLVQTGCPYTWAAWFSALLFMKAAPFEEEMMTSKSRQLLS